MFLTLRSGLLPEGSFEDVRYGGHDTPLASYEWFANNTDGSESNRGKGLGTRVKRLKRGYSSEADTLLDWLVGPIGI